MSYLNIFTIFIFVFFYIVNEINSEDNEKSSLTFVIDDTASMYNDIDQVKQAVHAIFDAVTNTNDSQIENFVITTFNDPEVGIPYVTKNREAFRRVLDDIVVHGGWDCPEFSLTGIEKGLEASLPGSYLYVCTDAAAKDSYRYEHVKALAQKKGSKINFLLTKDDCDPNAPDDKFYDKIAKSTDSEVFHLEKTDIRDILDYVIENIKGRRTTIARKEFPPGENKFNVTVDHKTKELMVSASGESPKLGVTGPDGEKVHLTEIVRKEKVAIYKDNATKPGLHTITVESLSESTVLVTGKTKFQFKHGFSTFVPTSLNDTATRPPSDMKSFLSIQLIEGDGVELKSVKFKDSEDNIISDELPFRVVDEKNKFYLTDPIDIPKEMFKISVTCYDIESNTYMVRVSSTFIEAVKILDPPKSSRPTITIDGEPKIDAEYDEPLKLKCKIHAYPEPTVLWQSKESGATLKSRLSIKELPYDYISFADIDKVNKNETYVCIATNEHGSAEKQVAIETINKYYFYVVEEPKDTVIEYQKQDKIFCSVNANPPASISWYFDGAEIINELSDEHLLISDDNTTLLIKDMAPDVAGDYVCEVRNQFDRKLFNFNVDISGLEPPLVNKSVKTISARSGTTVDIDCKVIKGTPEPWFIWYFRQYSEEFKKNLKYNKNVLKIKNIGIQDAGVYRCFVYNLRGDDFHDTQLVIEYPAIIKDASKNILIKEGERVHLHCKVDGVPRPNIRWFKNNVIMTSSRTVHISRDRSVLRFTAALDNAGNYVCTAENKLGKVNHTISVDVYVPVSIESPKESNLKIKVGTGVVLPCRADGYPKPDINWKFLKKNATTSKFMRTKDINLALPRMQLKDQGYYICSASNVGGSANITYDIQVLAPPLIENINPDKTIHGVVGDLAIRIPCRATGSPKPSITWSNKDGLNIASGSEWYDIEEDGTLVIKNVDRESAGVYVCEARNYMGVDNEVYQVVVDAYPRPGKSTSTILVGEGESVFLKCDIPHKPLDFIRWYKEGRLISRGEYQLKDVTFADSGIYTCRVSDFSKSRTGTTRVVIGFKPRFLSNVDEEIPFEEEKMEHLDCDAVAEPLPEVTWLHNDKLLNDTNMVKMIEMKFEDIGVYTCVVSNKFGTIKRNFKITSSDCFLDLSKDFDRMQPLMINSPLSWVNFDTSGGYMRIPENSYMTLYCASAFKNFPQNLIMAFCQGGTNFKVNGKTNYKYSDMKCNQVIDPVFESTGISCLRGKGDLINIGYKAFGSILKAYEICYDKSLNSPIYSKHAMKNNLAETVPTDIMWRDSELVRLNFETLYDCSYQNDYISRNLGMWFRPKDHCCFSKRQLVNARDMVPGLAQMATYSVLNLVPQWSSCTSENWNDIEERVRKLAKSIVYELTVFTGVSNNIQMQKVDNSTWDLHITDGRGQLNVPLYLWKVIQDPITKSSLAIIQVNVPDLKKTDVYKYVRCRNICNRIEWMRNPNWEDVNRGYTYCCSLNEFISNFNLRSVFDEKLSKILYYVSSISVHSLA